VLVFAENINHGLVLLTEGPKAALLQPFRNATAVVATAENHSNEIATSDLIRICARTGGERL
jgi:hypothetical protein